MPRRLLARRILVQPLRMGEVSPIQSAEQRMSIDAVAYKCVTSDSVYRWVDSKDALAHRASMPWKLEFCVVDGGAHGRASEANASARTAPRVTGEKKK